MKRKHYFLIGGLSIGIIIAAMTLWSSESSPETTLEDYLRLLNQRDFDIDDEQALHYIHITEENEDFMAGFKEAFHQRTAFNDYQIGEPNYLSDDKATLPVTITWDEYWEHSFSFTLELINLEWVIVPDYELISIIEAFDYRLEQFVQTNLNYLNSYEAPPDVGLQLDVPATFDVYLLGIPKELRYDAENQSLTLPIITEETRLSENAPKAYAAFPDGSEVYYNNYFSFLP